MNTGFVGAQVLETSAQKTLRFVSHLCPFFNSELDHNHSVLRPRTSTGAGCFVLYHANLACSVYTVEAKR